MHLIPYECCHTRQLRFDIAKSNQELDLIEHHINLYHEAQFAFEQEYQKRIGDIVEAVLLLRVQLGITESVNSTESSITHLIDEDFKQLKESYRRAAKMCHPDYLQDKLKSVGLDIFDHLTKAYHLRDIVSVEHILWMLESGQAFTDSPTVIVSKDLLVKRKELLGLMITQKIDYLERLQSAEEYDICNRDNWNILLYDYQTQLEDELALLRQRAQ